MAAVTPAVDQSVAAAAPPAAEGPRLTRAAWLGLAELQHYLSRPGAALMRWIPRSALEDRYLAQLVDAGYVQPFGLDHVSPTDAGRRALIEHDLVGSIEHVRERLGYPAGHGVRRYRTWWLNDPERRR